MSLFSRNKNAGSRSQGMGWWPLAITAAVIGLALTLYIGYRASLSDRKIFSVSLLAMLLGLLFESFRVARNWKSVLGIFFATYAASFISYLPGKHEYDYIFEEHIVSWPYYFIIIYALLFAIFYKDDVTAKLTEGGHFASFLCAGLLGDRLWLHELLQLVFIQLDGHWRSLYLLFADQCADTPAFEQNRAADTQHLEHDHHVCFCDR